MKHRDFIIFFAFSFLIFRTLANSRLSNIMDECVLLKKKQQPNTCVLGMCVHTLTHAWSEDNLQS